MNTYLVALIGLVVLLVVGYLVYGVLFKDAVKGHEVKLDTGRFIAAGIAMYLISLAFVHLYNNSDVSSYSGVMKGAALGLLVGVAFWALPFFADSSYLKPNSSVMWAVLLNWVISFVVLGSVVGYLLK